MCYTYAISLSKREFTRLKKLHDNTFVCRFPIIFHVGKQHVMLIHGLDGGGYSIGEEDIGSDQLTKLYGGIYNNKTIDIICCYGNHQNIVMDQNTEMMLNPVIRSNHEIRTSVKDNLLIIFTKEKIKDTPEYIMYTGEIEDYKW